MCLEKDTFFIFMDFSGVELWCLFGKDLKYFFFEIVSSLLKNSAALKSPKNTVALIKLKLKKTVNTRILIKACYLTKLSSWENATHYIYPSGQLA